MRVCARVLHAQLFAALLGIGVPAVASYVATWFVARHSGLAHGFHCRLQTTAAAALILFAVSGDGRASLLSAAVTSCLPQSLLWWPPKAGQNARQFDALEEFVRGSIELLAQRHVERPLGEAALPPSHRALPHLMNALRQKPVEHKRHYMFVARLVERE
jgi:hypothetical protein